MRIISIWPGSSPVSFPPTIWLNEACLLRPGRPFFIPDWDSDFRWIPMLALKIERVGKSIPARFAGRYISHASVWLQAIGAESVKALGDAGMPPVSAVGFDYSLASATFVEMSIEEASRLKAVVKAGEREFTLDASACISPAETFATVSTRNTVRTGDLLLIPFPAASIPMHRGEEVTVTLKSPHEAELLRFQIK